MLSLNLMQTVTQLGTAKLYLSEFSGHGQHGFGGGDTSGMLRILQPGIIHRTTLPGISIHSLTRVALASDHYYHGEV